MAQKEYKLNILRLSHQIQAEQFVHGYEWKVDIHNIKLYNSKGTDSKITKITNVEKHCISLDVFNPNLLDLYSKIQEVCPEFLCKKSFHLYWKCSPSRILPVSNHITYLSMVSQIANENKDLYVIDRKWDEPWISNIGVTYTALPMDTVLVNMVAPHNAVYTKIEESQLNCVKAASTSEFSTTYTLPIPKLSGHNKKDKDKKDSSPQTKIPKDKKKKPK